MKHTFLTIALMLGLSSYAGAWTLISPDVKGWPRRKVTIQYNPESCPVSPDVYKRVLGKALEVWNGVTTSDLELTLATKETSVTPSEFMSGNAKDVPVIVCDESFGVTHPTADPNGVPAAAFPGKTFPLQYGGVVMNAQKEAKANISRYSESLLTLIVAHEIGHVLGLGHSSQKNALMYFSVAGKTEARLSQDDRDAVTYLYPRKEFSATAFGCAAIHQPTNTLPSLMQAMTLAFLLLLPVGSRLLRKFKIQI